MADDKLVYTYMPDIIRYYLAEEPVIRNVDTWRMGEPEAREEVLDRLDELVLKPVDGSGGKGIVIGPVATQAELDELRAKVLEDPRSWIAQPVVQLSTVPTFVDGRLGARHVDLRPFAVNDGERVWVLPGGLTRVALAEGELIVNSSRGGGSKDTWVLAGPTQVDLEEHEDDEPRDPSARPQPATRAEQPAPATSSSRPTTPPRCRAVRCCARCSRRPSSSSRAGLVLSRIAESMFWIGRYVERAEDTARILDVQTQLILEDSGIDEVTTCRTLLSIMGVEDEDPAARPGRVDMAQMLDMLCYDPSSPVSIASAFGAARESARRARETLSVPMWEAINTTYRAIPSGQFHAQRPPAIFQWVRERAALINGTADATMVRDEGWHFLMLGRCVERADMTSRLVATAAVSGGIGAPWTTTLRACGAYEVFLRTYRGMESERGGRRVPAARPAVPAVGGVRAQPGRAVPRQPRGVGPAGRLPERGAAAARPDARRARVPLAHRPDGRPARRRWSASSAPAPRPPRRSPGATSPAPRPWSGRGSRMTSMSMQLRIVHTTGYEYDGKAVASYNQARMTPVTTPGQIVVHSRLEVSPKPWTYEYRDYFGTHVTAFEVVDPHESLTVTATSTVQTNRPPTPAPVTTWEALAERDVADRWTEYLTLPELVEPPVDFARARRRRTRRLGAARRGRARAVPPGRGRGRAPPRRDRRADPRGRRPGASARACARTWCTS